MESIVDEQDFSKLHREACGSWGAGGAQEIRGTAQGRREATLQSQPMGFRHSSHMLA